MAIVFGDARLPSRFWEQIRQQEHCWIWTGSVSKNKYSEGYGLFYTGRCQRLAHRIAFMVLVRLPEEAMVLDHTCRNTLCCNPDHLDEVTQLVNVQRGNAGKFQREKTHCPAGHEYSEANTYLFKGKRQCRECRRIRNRPSDQRRRAGLPPGRVRKRSDGGKAGVDPHFDD